MWPKYSFNKNEVWSKLFRQRFIEAKIELERLKAEEQKELDRKVAKIKIEKFRHPAIMRDFLPSRIFRK